MLILISDFATELDDGEVCNPGPITPVQVITCFSHFFCFHFEFQYIFYFFLFPFARFLFILIYIGHFSKIMKLFVLYLFYSNLVLALKTFKHQKNIRKYQFHKPYKLFIIIYIHKSSRRNMMLNCYAILILYTILFS